MVRKQDKKEKAEEYGTISNEEFRKMMRKFFKETRNSWKDLQRSKVAIWTTFAHSSP